MKRITTLGIIVLFGTQLSFAFEGSSPALFQSEKDKKSIVSGGIGIGLGIFYPSEVNQYIEDRTSHLLITTGIAGMISNYFLRASINVRPHRIIEISGFIEGAWAPKFIVVSGGEDYYFSFTRFSPGVSPKIHIPFGSGRHSIYFAPAVTYNFLKFTEGQSSGPKFKVNRLGGKFLVGFNLDFRKIQLQPFIGYDHARGTGTDSNYGDMELSYCGAQLGVELHF